MHIDLTPHTITDARILIVDDEANNVQIFKSLLDRAGYAVCICMTDPRQVVARFADMQPDILLLDWHMEPLSGLEVLRALQTRIRPEDMPPVLVLTADTSAQTKREALEAGATDFLAKPLDFSEVLLRMRNLLHLRALHLHSLSENLRLEEKVQDRTAQLEHAISEVKELQQQIVEQERLRALGSMAAGISHDFNNALMIIKGYSDLFVNQPALCEDARNVRDCFATIATASQDATEIVRRLREFSRPYNRNEEDRRPVDLNDLVEQAVQLTRPKWQTQTQGNGISVEVETALAELPRISAAAGELRDVLVNLIFNAVDAMPQGGQITVSTGLDEGQVFFQVEDTGTGMTEETRRHCLEPFYTTKGDHGTGLGLAITHGIVRRHAGIIRINSELNCGTQVIVVLPVTDPGEITSGDEPMPQRRTQPLKVLVVDDQPDICHVLSCYLEQDAHTVVTAENGCEALEKFRTAHFDLVITDRAMPKMNGDQLATAIKEINPEGPVILLTAFADTSRPSMDIDLLLSKPASLRALRDAINRVTAA